MIKNILIIFAGYLIGAIPFSVIVARIKGVNLLKEAVDGARGTSLTWQKAGKVYGFLVGILDVSKGFLAGFFAKKFSGNNLIVVILTILFAIIGHNWSIYIKLTGGKGAATTAGGLLYILPREFLITISIMAIPFFYFKNNKYLSFFKRKFKKSNFLSGVFFGICFIFSFLFNGVSFLAFSPLFFSLPMLVKDLQIRHNERKIINK